MWLTRWTPHGHNWQAHLPSSNFMTEKAVLSFLQVLKKKLISGCIHYVDQMMLPLSLKSIYIFSVSNRLTVTRVKKNPKNLIKHNEEKKIIKIMMPRQPLAC